MLRSGQNLATVGCHIGRRSLHFRPQAIRPPSPGVIVRGQLFGLSRGSLGAGLLSTRGTAANFSAARGSMTAAHRGQRSGVCGVDVSEKWGAEPRSALGSVDIGSMYVVDHFFMCCCCCSARYTRTTGVSSLHGCMDRPRTSMICWLSHMVWFVA